MTTPESFGNPNNPFNESQIVENELAAYRISIDYWRRPASEMITSMVCFSDSVVCEELDDGRIKRSLVFDCTAPYTPTHGLYVNAALDMMDGRGLEFATAPAQVLLADVIDDGQISQRWIQLRHPQAESFGVTGVSRQLPGGDFERWSALTLNMLPRPHSVPDISLWGESMTQEGNATTLLAPTGDRCFEAHRIALCKAISRPRRRIFPET